MITPCLIACEVPIQAWIAIAVTFPSTLIFVIVRNSPPPSMPHRKWYAAANVVLAVFLATGLSWMVAAIVTPPIHDNGMNDPWSKVKSDISAIKSASTRFQLREGRAPRSMAELIERRGNRGAYLYVEEELLDPWGQPYRLEVIDVRVEVSSSGPDQEPGTEDDISSSRLSELR